MRNIAEIVEEVIQETGKSEPLKVLAKEVVRIDAGYKKLDGIELQALIHTTLSVDGRFVYLNDCWDIKSRYSVTDLEKIKEEYIKNIDDLEIVNLEKLERELEDGEDISSLKGPDKNFDEEEEVVLEVEN